LAAEPVEASVIEHAEVLGLQSLFACLRTIYPTVVFFLSHFLQSTHNWHIAFSRSSKKSISQSAHEAKKKSGTPTTTTVPEMRQKKTTQSYYT